MKKLSIQEKKSILLMCIELVVLMIFNIFMRISFETSLIISELVTFIAATIVQPTEKKASKGEIIGVVALVILIAMLYFYLDIDILVTQLIAWLMCFIASPIVKLIRKKNNSNNLLKININIPIGTPIYFINDGISLTILRLENFL